MPIVTFISDFGSAGPYVATVKAKLLALGPHVPVVDISHEIHAFNIGQAAFVLKNAYPAFPKGTVHLIGLNTAAVGNKDLLAAEINGHFFTGLDNGIFSLIADIQTVKAVKVGFFEKDSFPQAGILAETAIKLAMGEVLDKLGKPTDILRMLDRQLRVTKNSISASVAYIDHYGNLITNLKAEVFDKVRRERTFSIHIGREVIGSLHHDYNEQEPGEILARFNSYGYLEIAINQGEASGLLGIALEAPLRIQFTPEID